MKVFVERGDLEMIQSFLECDDVKEALKILNAVLEEV